MADNQIDKLLHKLNTLTIRQEQILKEISDLRSELQQMKSNPDEIIDEKIILETSFTPIINSGDEISSVIQPENPYLPPVPLIKPTKSKGDTEKYIGENLISKIGITVLVIGVGIGAKYSIDHDLISPLMRIILGYGVGITLAGFGIRLKKAYPDFSAVLVSGAIAIMYFITYAAFSFYALMPQFVAFAMMVIFTGLTVFAALRYDKQIIAHIGLVGAYGVPFLLGRETADVVVLYSYMAIINIGILSIAIMKYWKPLYYSSFALTWLIFALWYFMDYQPVIDYNTFWTFAIVFFTTFYLIFIGYKLKHKEKFQYQDIMLILSNSFIFYGLGYSALNNFFHAESYLGLFTLGNALLHAVVSIVV
nr:DUF2339 domain-containing protein [Bacteroidota bacterium]